MDLTVDDIEKYLYKIFTAQDIINVNKGDAKISIIFKQPDNIIKLKANNVYDASFASAVEDEILPLKELEELIKKRNIFTESDEAQVKKLKSKLDAQQILLSKITKVKANSDRIKGVIEDIKQQIAEIEYKKFSKLSMSAETKAEEDRTSYLCWSCAYNIDNELYWLTYEDFLNETDLSFRNEVLTKFLKFYGGIDTKTVRFIARSSLWRIRYVTSQKVSESLFGIPTSQYTNDQLNLAYWSNFYQSIYEMFPEDKPSDIVIEDDDALDAYMHNYYEERNREDAARRSKKKTRGKLSAFDSEEVIVTQSNELYEEIDYDKPREARMVKDKADFRKKPKSKSRIGQAPDWVYKKKR